MSERGQASLLLVVGVTVVLLGALVLGAVARGVGVAADGQRAADLGALAGARAMRASYWRLFEPREIDGLANRLHLEQGDYLALGRAAALATARSNGAQRVSASFPDGDSFAPVRIRVTVTDPVEVAIGRGHREVTATLVAEAELAPPGALPSAGGGGYAGPLVERQGKRMRPDVALAFDRMARAAATDGVALIVASAFRSDAEQALLFARRPDPKWVAPPGRSFHRLATELDLGPPAAYAWLARHAARFHFVNRYQHEPWHYGYSLNAGSRLALRASAARDGGEGRSIPDFVPARFAPALARAAQRWNVSAALLAAQIYVESRFNPFAVSTRGARGIAQFMPGTARAYGLSDPLDAEAAIEAQAHLMRDLLRQFASVPLALAAYNAGPGHVAACGCVPAIAETRGYVARVLGLLGGVGEAPAGGGLELRLVR